MANAEKVAAVAELTERFRDSSGAVLTEYRGLTVAQLAELRKSLGDHATFAVVKNTLTKIAVTDAGLKDQLSSLLVGPSAVAFVDGDVVEAAKGLPEVQTVLWFARFPVTRFHKEGTDSIVEISDLRFPQMRPDRPASFTYRVRLAADQTVLSQGWVRPR